MQFMLRSMRDEDWPAVQAIYREGIATGNATFETTIPDWETWARNHLRDCRIVATEGDRVIGWAALSHVSIRHVYRGVAEVSVYVAAFARCQGVGKALLQALVKASEQAGIWTLQASVFPENEASIALHKWCGFREVGHRERIGQLREIWRDTMLLERRSQVVGAMAPRTVAVGARKGPVFRETPELNGCDFLRRWLDALRGRLR
jgi:L-amino acid N-acyltransferase YncA